MQLLSLILLIINVVILWYFMFRLKIGLTSLVKIMIFVASLNSAFAAGDKLEEDQSSSMRKSVLVPGKLMGGWEGALVPHIPVIVDYLDVTSACHLQKTCIRFYNGVNKNRNWQRARRIFIAKPLYPREDIALKDFEKVYQKSFLRFIEASKLDNATLLEENPMLHLTFQLLARHKMLDRGFEAVVMAKIQKLVFNRMGDHLFNMRQCCGVLNSHFRLELMDIVLAEAYRKTRSYFYGEDNDRYASMDYQIDRMKLYHKYAPEMMTFDQLVEYFKGLKFLIQDNSLDDVSRDLRAQSLAIDIMYQKFKCP